MQFPWAAPLSCQNKINLTVAVHNGSNDTSRINLHTFHRWLSDNRSQEPAIFPYNGSSVIASVECIVVIQSTSVEPIVFPYCTVIEDVATSTKRNIHEAFNFGTPPAVRTQRGVRDLCLYYPFLWSNSVSNGICLLRNG